MANADFIIPVTIEDVIHNVYVIKRPGKDVALLCMTRWRLDNDRLACVCGDVCVPGDIYIIFDRYTRLTNISEMS